MAIAPPSSVGDVLYRNCPEDAQSKPNQAPYNAYLRRDSKSRLRVIRKPTAAQAAIRHKEGGWKNETNDNRAFFPNGNANIATIARNRTIRHLYDCVRALRISRDISVTSPK